MPSQCPQRRGIGLSGAQYSIEGKGSQMLASCQMAQGPGRGRREGRTARVVVLPQVLMGSTTIILTIVDELERYGVLLTFERLDDGLKVVTALRAHANRVTLNLGVYLGELIADELADLTRELL